MVMRPSIRTRAVIFALLIATCPAGADNQPSYQQGKITGWGNQLYERNFTINTAYPKASRKFYELNSSGMVYQIDCGPFDIGQTLEYRVDGKKIYIRQANGKEQTCGIASYKAIAGASSAITSSAAPSKPH